MKTTSHFSRRVRWILLAALLIAGSATAFATRSRWWPVVQTQLARLTERHEAINATENHEHAGHDHGHAGHEEANSIELSERALKNVGFRPLAVQPGEFLRTVTMPAMVVERPGKSQRQITAPISGIVTRIHVTEGEGVAPGAPLFDIRLMHEELIAAQRDFLKSAEGLDVVNREIARLKGLTEGVIAGKRLLEQEYEKQKIEAGFKAERQSLLLHGLSDEQIEAILKTRKLHSEMKVVAPSHDHEGTSCREDHLFHAQKLNVQQGQQVEAGAALCVLADHCELYLEGRAFEEDAGRLRTAAKEGWELTAIVPTGEGEPQTVRGLKVLYLADHVESESRAFRFYLRLPNEVALDRTDGPHRFIQWRFRPGQRLEVRVPVERWEKRIVLPVDAVVDEGAQVFVYVQNGDHFDRREVHVEYRDQRSVVIANDGAVFPGDIVAAKGAYQMHLALKNKSGGGIDPHAGHNH